MGDEEQWQKSAYVSGTGPGKKKTSLKLKLIGQRRRYFTVRDVISRLPKDSRQDSHDG
jgi:hypothetical protein